MTLMPLELRKGGASSHSPVVVQFRMGALGSLLAQAVAAQLIRQPSFCTCVASHNPSISMLKLG